MKKIFLTVFILTFVFGFNCLIYAQFTDEEVAERAKWEDFLQNAEIVSGDQPFNEREAVTKPWKLTLEMEELRGTNERICGKLEMGDRSLSPGQTSRTEHGSSNSGKKVPE
jgi:hypothetical protein